MSRIQSYGLACATTALATHSRSNATTTTARNKEDKKTVDIGSQGALSTGTISLFVFCSPCSLLCFCALFVLNVRSLFLIVG